MNVYKYWQEGEKTSCVCSIPRKIEKSISNILIVCLTRWSGTQMDNEFISHPSVTCNETWIKTLEQLNNEFQRVCGLVSTC